MNEFNDLSIKSGPVGEPIIRSSPSTQVGNETPPFCFPLNDKHSSKLLQPTVEVVPGILVSQHLIDAAVGEAEKPSFEKAYHSKLKSNERSKKRNALREGIKEEIEVSKQIVQSMLDKRRNPPNMQEKYVSFDAMPAPLQRVVSAYMAVTEANKELELALGALKKDVPVAA